MFGSKNRSRKESRREREALIASMPVDEDGCVPEKYLLERNGLRSRRAIMADGRSTAKRVYPLRMPPEQAASWVMNPGRYDVEGIDTRAPANVERRGTGKKPKAPAGKAAGPKPKAPKPVPARESGVVVSGREIVDTVKLITSVTGNNTIHLGSRGLASDGDCLVMSLSRRDGKGLFGLDLGLAERYAIAAPAPMKKLSVKSVYKLTVEDDQLVFRRGPDFSKAELSVPLIPLESPIPADALEELFSMSKVAFDPDAEELRRAADVMAGEKTTYCTLTSAHWGAHLISEDGPKIDRVVGGPTDRHVSSVYTVKALRSATKETSRYVERARYGQDRPLVLEGTFGEYGMTVLVVDMKAA